MHKKSVFRIIVSLFAVSAVFAFLTVYYEKPVVENICVESCRSCQDGNVRFVLVADLHSCRYGKKQSLLIEMIDGQKPDAILLTGDIFDDKIADTNAKNFLEDIVKKYKCFYVTGNHEVWSGRADEMKNYLRHIGIEVLEGDCVRCYFQNLKIDVCGISDPYEFGIKETENQLQSAFSKTDSESLKILLSHRPEKIELYEKYGFDIVFTGHAHGGQWRLPFVNVGFYAPDQSFFAKYVNGRYVLKNGTVLIVSRGLARESTRVPRFGNHPELLIVDVKAVSEKKQFSEVP